jgi:hypothetical protein
LPKGKLVTGDEGRRLGVDDDVRMVVRGGERA